MAVGKEREQCGQCGRSARFGALSGLAPSQIDNAYRQVATLLWGLALVTCRTKRSGLVHRTVAWFFRLLA